MKDKYKVMKVYQVKSFVYKWVHIPSQMWYIGSRTSKKGHVNDGYLCSSDIVKSMITENPTEWIREIIATGTAEEMLMLESTLLISLNAKDDPNSFNRHNNDGKFRFWGGKPQSAAHRTKISNALTGTVRSEETRKKLSDARKGKPNPKQSIATKGVPKPNVSKAKKGVPQPKVLCRITDRKEMCLSHFNRWCNRQDDPTILKAIFEKRDRLKQAYLN